MTVIHTYPYTIGTGLPLNKNDVTSLIRLFETQVLEMDAPLEGRAATVHTQLESIGNVVIKYFRRGGFIGRFIKSSYLRSGKPRSRLEFEMLDHARTFGVNVPEPLVWAIRGGLFYKAFLVTREIPSVKSLMTICHEEKKKLSEILEKAASEIAILIQNRIHHVDLHPGNILVDEKDNVYLIDFDKAEKSPLPEQKLAAAYLKRWNRAVEKYGLPRFLTEVMESELMKNRL